MLGDVKLKQLSTLENPLPAQFIRPPLMDLNGLVSQDLETLMTQQHIWFHLSCRNTWRFKIDITFCFPFEQMK